MATGPAELELALREYGGERRIARAVEIRAGDFRSERIALDSAMTDLRTSDDPRIAEQSAELWRVLHAPDRSARYAPHALKEPVEEYRLTSLFGDRRTFDYIDGESARSIHNGVDMAAPTGTPVSSPAAGRVVLAQNRILTGWTLVIEHLPGVYSMFFHMDEIAVSAGDRVELGGELGTVGSTGLSTGPHLHWELRVAGAAVDAWTYREVPLVDMRALAASLSTSP